MTTLNNTSRALKIYLIAGEPSGDLLGSRLMRALRAKTGGNVEFSDWAATRWRLRG